MMQLPEGYDSIFRYIVVVSQRAEQLINGANARTEGGAEKPTLQAKCDVDAGEVGWRILTQEELDAQRQAIVEQFRAEVSDDRRLDAGEIPDVLPTGATETPAAAEPVAEVGGGERDDELARLQRLLGMVGGAATETDEADESSDGEAVDALDVAEPADEVADDGAASDADASGLLDLDEDETDG